MTVAQELDTALVIGVAWMAIWLNPDRISGSKGVPVGSTILQSQGKSPKAQYVTQEVWLLGRGANNTRCNIRGGVPQSMSISSDRVPQSEGISPTKMHETGGTGYCNQRVSAQE